jgi:uncharacterized protein (TIGR03435 family)
VFLATAILAIAAQTPVSFETASVRVGLSPAESRAAGRAPGIKIDGSLAVMTAMSLTRLVMMAYRVEAEQISGPDWMASTSFDIVGKLPAGVTKEEVPDMVRTLLVERFKLILRRDVAERPVYALTAGKNGPSLPSAGDGRPCEDPRRGGRVVLAVFATDNDGCRTISRRNGVLLFEADRITIEDFTRILRPYVDLPVVDKTDFKGAYQIALEVPNVGGRMGGVLRAGWPRMPIRRGCRPTMWQILPVRLSSNPFNGLVCVLRKAAHRSNGW